MAAKFDMIIAAKTTGSAAIKRMGNNMQGLQGRLKNVRMAALSVNTAFKAMAIILTAGTFSRFVTGAINQADAFGKLSRQTGIAADSLQAYVNAGKLAGVEQGTIEKGLRRLAQSMREADQGVATYSDAYKALGVSVRDSDGNLKESEVVLAELADQFQGMQNGATKAALAMEIFGRSGAQLIPMLNEGGDALERWNYETSEGFAANAEYFNDQLTMLSFGFDGFRKQLADALLPTLNNLLGMFRNIFSSKNDWDGLFKGIEVGLKIISSSVFTVVAGFRFLLTTIKAIATGLGELAQGNFGAAKDAFGAGLKKTNEQFKKDMEVFNQIWTGDENAPASYFAEGTREANKFGKELAKTFGAQMQAKITSFKDSIKTVGEAMSDVVIKGIKGMEDALVDFVTSGKLAFKDLANSIIKDMIRIAIQQSITAPFSNFIGGLFKGPQKGFPPLPPIPEGMAKGGFVSAGTSYLVGERGPELLRLGSKGGHITPNHQLGGNTSVVVNVDAKGQSSVQGDQGQAAALGRAISAAVTQELIKQRRNGGILSAA
jgi:hypothetical protein